MKGIGTLMTDVKKMKVSIEDPEFLEGLIYIQVSHSDDIEMDLAAIGQYFGFDGAVNTLEKYYSLYAGQAVLSPNTEEISRMVVHLRKIGLYSDTYEPYVLHQTDKTKTIYSQILDGTFPESVDWEAELPYHPDQDLSGYKTT